MPINQRPEAALAQLGRLAVVSPLVSWPCPQDPGDWQDPGVDFGTSFQAWSSWFFGPSKGPAPKPFAFVPCSCADAGPPGVASPLGGDQMPGSSPTLLGSRPPTSPCNGAAMRDSGSLGRPAGPLCWRTALPGGFLCWEPGSGLQLWAQLLLRRNG